MKTSAVCLLLAISVSFSTPVFAAGSIAESMDRLAKASAQHDGIRPEPSGEGMFWAGLALIGAGATVEILSYTTLKNESIVFCPQYGLCRETSTNTGVLAAGAAIAVTGVVLQTIGWRKMHPMLTFGPRPSAGVRIGF